MWPPSASSPRARPRSRRGTRTSGSTAPTRPPRRCPMPAGTSLMEPFDVMDAGRMAVFTDPEGAAFCVWQAKQHKGARIVNEHGSLNFNGLNTRDPRGRRSVLRLGVRMGDARRSSGGAEMWRCRATATTSSERHPGPPQADGRDGRPGGLRGRGREPESDRQRAARRPGALERHVRGRRRRRDRLDGGRARRTSARGAVRRPVGEDDGDRRSRRARRSSRASSSLETRTWPRRPIKPARPRRRTRKRTAAAGSARGV